MKVGIIRCLNTNDVCAGSGCLNSFNQKKDFFKDYSEDTELLAFMTCSGCNTVPREHDGLNKKIDRISELGIEKIHVGACRKKAGVECETMNEVLELIEEKDISVIRGTHKEK